MRNYRRYVVVNERKKIEHSYSTDLGNDNAFIYASECADHRTMNGRVFGEDSTGARQVVYTSKTYRDEA